MSARKAEKKLLTARFVEGLKATGSRYQVFDEDCRGLAVRVGKSGSKSYVLIKAYPGSQKTSARSLGSTDALTLSEAREKARSWIKLIARGIDPVREEERAREAAAEKKAATFGAVVEDYISRHVRKHRKAKDVEREIRKELIPCWGSKPVTEITRRDVVKLVEAIADRGAPYQARNVLGHIKTFYNWAINRGIYG